jgi:[CysO sulfur-carrier protein]-thiocarboxylate-dependent cysteine synthase
MITNSVLDLVGNTPLVKIADIDSKNKVYVKLEGSNPTGSVKDRAAKALILDKIEKKELTPGKTIIDASSGSFSCAMAYFGKILGFNVLAVCGSKLTQDKANFISYFGAEIIKYGDFTIQGNEYCRNKIIPKNPEKYCFLDQLHNWENPKTHFQITAPEIFNKLQNIGAIVFSLGSGGTLTGIAQYVKKYGLSTKIIAVTAESGTKIPGTLAISDGDYLTPFILEARKNKLIDYEQEINLIDACKMVDLMKKKGLYVGIQTGGVYAGYIKAAQKLNIQGNVVLISGDSGWKNMDKLINMEIISSATVS